MTLIEGIGDEVTQFFICLFVTVIVSLAWWTTNISEQRHVRTVLLLDRRRHLVHNHRRLVSSRIETVSITDSASNESIEAENLDEEEQSTSPLAEGGSRSADEVRQFRSRPADRPAERSEEELIIHTMDNDSYASLRQRRLAFYEQNPTTELRNSEVAETAPTDCRNDDAADDKKSESAIRIKLKYINDDLKLVDGKLEELLGDFKRRHFQLELSSNKIVRLIFNGQVLKQDRQTLQHCGLFDNCVVHCLVHQNRNVENTETVSGNESRTHDSVNENHRLPNLNNNNNNQGGRDWDLGNSLFAFISFILLAAWYLRYVYAHLYTVTATVGLILITGLFTIVLVGMYFPDNENMPNPRIHIQNENIPPRPDH